MASYVGYAAWPVMVRQMATTALLLVHFSDSPLLGGRCGGVGSCAVWGFGVNRRQMGKTVAGPAPTACVACGRRGGRRVVWGVVLGCGFCAVVGVFMA